MKLLHDHTTHNRGLLVGRMLDVGRTQLFLGCAHTQYRKCYQNRSKNPNAKKSKTKIKRQQKRGEKFTKCSCQSALSKKNHRQNQKQKQKQKQKSPSNLTFLPLCLVLCTTSSLVSRTSALKSTSVNRPTSAVMASYLCRNFRSSRWKMNSRACTASLSSYHLSEERTKFACVCRAPRPGFVFEGWNRGLAVASVTGGCIIVSGKLFTH